MLSLGRGPSLGLLLGDSRPNSGELVSFLGDAPLERPSIEGSGCSFWGVGVALEAIVGPSC
jgi:hypothetical protein